MGRVRLHEKQPTQNDMLSGSMASVYMNYEDSFQGTCKAYFVFETLYSQSEGALFYRSRTQMSHYTPI